MSSAPSCGRCQHLVLVSLLLLSSPAVAGEEEPSKTAEQEAQAPTIEDARAAFTQGTALMKEAQWAEAAKEFSFAASIKNTPGLRYYVGYCQEQQGLLVEALSSYRKAEALAETQPAPDVEELVPEAIERVMGQMPHLHLHDVPSGATIEVDGQERPLSAQFPLNPGQHQVIVTKKGYTRFEHTFTLKPGARGRVHVKMSPLDQGEYEEVDSWETDPEAQRRENVRRAVLWSGVGVGVVGIGVGVTGTILLSSANNEIDTLNSEFEQIAGGGDSNCLNPGDELTRVCSDLDSMGKKKNLGGNMLVGGFIGAGVGAATAVVAAFFWPEAPVQVQVGSTGRTSWLNVSGRF